MSLGLMEGVTQNTIKAISAMLAACQESHWPTCCVASGIPWAFIVLFSSIGVLTVLWLRIVYTRYETTRGLPIEYGTVHIGSVLGGLFLYQETTYMNGGD